MATNAAAVSGYLRSAGLNPSNNRKREGIRVTGSQRVMVSVDVDTPALAARLTAAVLLALAESTYTVERLSDTMWAVS